MYKLQAYFSFCLVSLQKKFLKGKDCRKEQMLLLHVCLLCNLTGLSCNIRKNSSDVFTGEMATGMYLVNILPRIYEKMETIMEII